jgi:hypothetical protein
MSEPIHSDPYTRITWLRERLEAAEAERDEANKRASEFYETATAATANRHAAEAEQRRLQDALDFQGDEHLKRAVLAETENRRLWEALALIPPTDSASYAIARAALAGSGDE